MECTRAYECALISEMNCYPFLDKFPSACTIAAMFYQSRTHTNSNGSFYCRDMQTLAQWAITLLRLKDGAAGQMGRTGSSLQPLSYSGNTHTQTTVTL